LVKKEQICRLSQTSSKGRVTLRTDIYTVSQKQTVPLLFLL